ncbi:heavy metal-associated domain-containing protein [Pilimelia columellifera]|uniref:Heavy-metal-associated domain-containing protein n=1 Tax=Pilimelia columellifera subsp. columellifera TaxID=706583 RepID=A0ABP6AB69_9ACTN
MDAITTTYAIDGMTCGHCVSAISAALGELDGVSAVAVDLGAKSATVTSDRPLDVESVREAVDDAGYELVSQR